jgi:hypothetical protein
MMAQILLKHQGPGLAHSKNLDLCTTGTLKELQNMENVINNIYSRHINTSLYSEMVDVPLLKFFRAPAHLIHPHLQSCHHRR